MLHGSVRPSTHHGVVYFLKERVAPPRFRMLQRKTPPIVPLQPRVGPPGLVNLGKCTQKRYGSILDEEYILRTLNSSLPPGPKNRYVDIQNTPAPLSCMHFLKSDSIKLLMTNPDFTSQVRVICLRCIIHRSLSAREMCTWIGPLVHDLSSRGKAAATSVVGRPSCSWPPRGIVEDRTCRLWRTV